MKLKKIKLNQLSRENLNNRQMNSLIGGYRNCACSCSATGGSSALDNGHANANGGDYGLKSPGGGHQHCWSGSHPNWVFHPNGF